MATLVIAMPQPSRLSHGMQEMWYLAEVFAVTAVSVAIDVQLFLMYANLRDARLSFGIFYHQSDLNRTDSRISEREQSQKRQISSVATGAQVVECVALAAGVHCLYAHHVANSSTLQSIGVVIASIAAIAGLVGLIIQLRLVIRSTKSQVYQGLITNSLKIDEILIERPQLRKYIYDCAPIPPTDVSSDELESFIELVVDVVDNLGAQERYIPDDARKGWRSFTSDLLRQPAVDAFLKSRGHWYSGLYILTFKKVDENNPVVQPTTTGRATSLSLSTDA